MKNKKPITSEQKVEEFLTVLEKELQKQNLTVPQFAVKMGIPKMTIYKWLNRESVMSLTKYYKAKEVLNLD